MLVLFIFILPLFVIIGVIYMLFRQEGAEEAKKEEELKAMKTFSAEDEETIGEKKDNK